MSKGNEEDNQFNLADFKQWMDGQREDCPYHRNFIGVYVESKISLKKLMHRMDTENEDAIKNIAKDFQENGGVIKEVDGHYFKVMVDSGDFSIHRMFVKKPD